jgi:hypothetical protein
VTKVFPEEHLLKIIDADRKGQEQHSPASVVFVGDSDEPFSIALAV